MGTPEASPDSRKKLIWGGIVVVLGTILALLPNRKAVLVLRPATETSWSGAISATGSAIGAVARRADAND